MDQHMLHNNWRASCYCWFFILFRKFCQPFNQTYKLPRTSLSSELYAVCRTVKDDDLGKVYRTNENNGFAQSEWGDFLAEQFAFRRVSFSKRVALIVRNADVRQVHGFYKPLNFIYFLLNMTAVKQTSCLCNVFKVLIFKSDEKV